MRLVQRSFSGGELGPSLYARDDLVKYEAGLARCRNFLPLVHGAVANRAGFEFLAEVKDSSRETRVVPFAFSTTQTYALEFGHLYLRVYKREGAFSGRVLVPAPVTAWSGATNYVVGDHALQGGVVYYCIAAHVNQIPPNATYWYPLAGGATTAIVEIPTPYTETELPRLKWTQSADVMTLFHPSHDPMELTRTDHHVWILAPITFGPKIAKPTGVTVVGSGTGADVSYVITAVHADTFEESEPSTPVTAVNVNLGNKVTVQWSAVTGAAKYHIYRKAKWTTAMKREEAIYSFVGTADQLSFEEIPEQASSASGENPPTTKDPFAGAGNKPGCGTYFEQRLVTGGSTSRPQGLDMSQSGNFHNFNISTPLRADDAIARVLNSRQANEIRHFIPLEQLLVLTSGGEWVVRGIDGAVTPLDFDARQQGYGGSSHVRPSVIKDTVILVQERGNLVRDLFFTLEADGYRGNDLTVLAEHLVRGRTIVDMDYAQVPDSVLWCVRDDGVLLSLTYNREHQVWGWAQHDTDGAFESVCAISEGDEDGLYVVVRRTIGGATKRFVERLHSRRFLGDVRDAFFVDSGLSYGYGPATTTPGDPQRVAEAISNANPCVVTVTGHGWPTDTIVYLADTGVSQLDGREFSLEVLTANTFKLRDRETLADIDSTDFDVHAASTGRVVRELALAAIPHLEGKTVTGLIDGNEMPPTVVPPGGNVVLPYAGTRFHVGLAYTGELETLDLSLVAFLRGVRDLKRVVAVRLHVEESRGGFVGPDAGHLYEIKWRDTEGYDEETRLLTGYVKTAIDSIWDERGRVFLRQVTPLPLTVLAMGFEFEASAEGGLRRVA